LFWRATSRATPILTGCEMISLGYPGHRFIAYPISRREAERGRSLINWVAEIGRDPASSFRREDWNRRGNLEEILLRFEGWMFDWLDVPAIMRAADAIYEYPCVDRDPLDRWTFGRVTLLGDAAHPMYPMGSNGASQAILDAKALALALQGDIDHALAAYEGARRPATTEIVLANRRQGPSEIQTIMEQRAPNGFDNVESVLSAAERAAIAEGYQRMAGFDRVSVNTDSTVKMITERGGTLLRS
jgi:2-polyprenyl-6-methoxyphenol hydroxylase-like FAD-dependent oxidoreductase